MKLCPYDQKFIQTRLQRKLRRMCACYVARYWLQDKSQKQGWDECHAGSWLVWLVKSLASFGAIHRKHYLAAQAAMNERGTGIKAVNRVRAAVPYSVVARAMTQIVPMSIRRLP